MEIDEKQPEEKVIKDFKQNDYSQSIIDQLKEKREVLASQQQSDTPPQSNILADKAPLTKPKPVVPPVKEEVKVDKLVDKIGGEGIGTGDGIVDKKDLAEIKKDLKEIKTDLKKSGSEKTALEQYLEKYDKKKSINDNFVKPKEVHEVIKAKDTPKVVDVVKKDVPPIKQPVEPLKVAKEVSVPETPKPITPAQPIVTKPTTEEIVFRKNKNPEKDGKIVTGWLVVHTENRSPVTYELFVGLNIIGRPDGPHHVDVLIEDDLYVSREHCYIEVQKDFVHRFFYILKDGKHGGKSSTNGTYINGLEERMDNKDVVYLKDGDTVQVGETKLAFKNAYESFDYQDAANSVISTDYTKTVVIDYKPK